MLTTRCGGTTDARTFTVALISAGALLAGCALDAGSPQPVRSLQQALDDRVIPTCGTRFMSTAEADAADEEFGLGVIDPISPPTVPGLSPGVTPVPSHGPAFPADFVPAPVGDEMWDVIPVAVHVILGTGGLGDVTDEQIEDQIQVLNDSWAGTTADDATASRFRFRLASIDRTENLVWFVMTPRSAVERHAKEALRVGGDNTLNLYTVGFGAADALGWSSFPWELEDDPDLDGVVVVYDTLPGGESEEYSEGDTATHEVGHWLGLLHTFQGGCDAPGDRVSDTFPQEEQTSGCPVSAMSCDTPDNIDNFMDYPDDACMDRFTPGQVRRMRRYYDATRAPVPTRLVEIVP